MSIYLGIDIGTTSAKCLAVSESGEVLALAQHAYALTHPHEGWAEQDPEDYWRGLIDVVNQCVNQLEADGRNRKEIEALSLGTQGDTLIVTDEAGVPLAPAMSWMDTRAAGECAELLKKTDQSFWYKHTGKGLPPFSSACKVRWIAKNNWDLSEKIKRYCFVPDFLTHRLCGKFVIDAPNASWTSFASSYERDWSEEVLRKLKISHKTLSKVVESGTTIGALLPDAAEQLALTPQTKVVAGAFDQAAAAHGAGVEPGARAVLSCGTAWVLYVVDTKQIKDELMKIPVCCHTNAGEWGAVLPFPGGAVYDWLRQNINIQAASGDGRSTPLIFIPHFYGGMSPDWRLESKGSLLGLTMSHTWKDVELALMRGVAFEARRNIEAAESLSGKIGSIRMVGGAAKSDEWPQIVANILGRQIEVSEFVESACYGAAKLAAGDISAKWPDPQEAKRIDPDPEQMKADDREYYRYWKFYAGMLSLYEEDAEEMQGEDE